MDVRCERCKAQYVLEDEQVTPSGLAVQCTNCGHLFRVKKKELVVTVPMKPGEAEGIALPAVGSPRPPSSRAPPAVPSAHRAAPPPPAPFLPPPFHEVDLGPDEEMMAPRRRRGARVSLVGALVVASGAAAAYALAGARPSAPAPASAPAMVTPVHDPGAARSAGSPAEPPESPPVALQPAPPPEPAAPVPAPEPAVDPVRTPEPVVQPPAPPAPRGPKALLAQAGRLREKGDVRTALELYGRVAAQDPENADALIGRGLCYLDLDRYAPAEASFDAALQIEPGHPDALLGLAEAYRFEGRKSEAIRQYERYLAAHPAGDEAVVARNAIEELKE